MNKVCPVCGTSFETQKKNKIYCCEACGNRALRRKKMGRSISDADFKKEYNALKVICICPICGKEFEKHPNNRMLYCSEECQIIGQKAYKHEYGKEYNKKYHEEHKEEISVRKKRYRQEHLEECRHRERESSKRCYRNNTEVYKNKSKRYRQSHKDKRNQYEKQRRKADPQYNLKIWCRNVVSRCLKGKIKSKHTFELLGYTADELYQWIESQFYEDMSWGNNNWEIHHIIPIGEYTDITEMDIKHINSLDNLIPLKIEDHKMLTKLYVSENRILTRNEICDIIKNKEKREGY